MLYLKGPNLVFRVRSYQSCSAATLYAQASGLVRLGSNGTVFIFGGTSLSLEAVRVANRLPPCLSGPLLFL